MEIPYLLVRLLPCAAAGLRGIFETPGRWGMGRTSVKYLDSTRKGVF